MKKRTPHIIHASDVTRARAQFLDLFRTADGCLCPVCDRVGKLQPIRYTYSLLRTLIELRRLELGTGQEWIHGPTSFSEKTKTINNIGKSANWDLCEPKENTDEPHKKTSGYWRTTELGRGFLEGFYSINPVVLIYNNKIVDFKGAPIFVHEVHGEFDYQEIVAAAAEMYDNQNTNQPTKKGTDNDNTIDRTKPRFI